MKKELCAGVIPVSRKNDGIYVLLVRHRKGRYWGFPKGHLLHQQEDIQQAAMRELEEETQLKVLRFLKIKPLQEQYLFSRDGEKIDKTVWYYIAETTTRFSIEREEILAAKWVNLQKLPSYASYTSAREVMTQAQRAILEFYKGELL